MTDTPLSILVDEATDKIHELRSEKNSFQQQCSHLADALAESQASHDELLEALEAVIEFDNENVLTVEGKAVGTDEDKALNKILVMAANAIASARGPA